LFLNKSRLMQMNVSGEWIPVVDEEGKTISAAPRSVCHDGKSKLLHPVVHFHLFNEKGDLFLQKRALTKDLLPGFWDTSAGGHMDPGENVDDALRREVLEELGISIFRYDLNLRYIWESPVEKELVYSFKGSSNEPPVINRDEIDDGRFWPTEEIISNLGRGIFTPNFEHEFTLIMKEFINYGNINSI